MSAAVCFLLLASASEPDPGAQLASVRKIFVDRLIGGETAAHLRDMIVAAIHTGGLLAITEDETKADAILRGSAEDLVFTDRFVSRDSVSGRASISGQSGSGGSRTGRYASVGIGQNESTDIRERKHEAAASVRLVARNGDVIWSATKESLGAKFKGASADVADKIMRQLKADLERARGARR